MEDRTDLALEAASALGQNLPDGVTLRTERRGSFSITRVEIHGEENARRLGKPPGRYVTVEGRLLDDTPQLDQLAALTARELAALLPSRGAVLVVGLGNHNVTPDSLGPKVAEQVLVTYHLPPAQLTPDGVDGFRPVAVLSPGVLGQTGLEAGCLASLAVSHLPLGAVVAVDALAAREPDRLGNTIQLSDSGISPGSGVEGGHQELSQASLGVPVVALGVPTVIDTGHFSPQGVDTRMLVTPHQVDRLILRAAQVLALGLNRALQPSLTPREIRSLMG